MKILPPLSVPRLVAASLASFVASSSARAQFVETTLPWPDTTFPCVVPADFDHDGDVDVLAAGEGQQGTAFATLYRNTNGNFADSGIVLTGLTTADAAFGDYDGDGDLDLAMSGLTTSGVTSLRIYRNDGATFTPIPGAYTNVYAGELAWGDLDLDGDLDLLVTGVTAQFFPAAVVVTRVYRNDAGVFTSVPHTFPDTYLGPLCLVDADHDGDLDVFLCGNSTIGVISTLYRNDSGTFVDAGLGLPGLSLGGADFADYDGDGDLDLALAGSTNNGYETHVYRNDAGTWVDLPGPFVGVVWADVRWGDHDLDGDADLVVMGYEPNAQVARTILYRNDAGSFVDSGETFHDLYLGLAHWVDVELDGDLDLMLAGNDVGNDVVRLYRNTRSTGSGFCFGDGSATSCPCGNAGLVRRGCVNGAGASAHLTAFGRASVANDSVVLTADGMPNGPALYFQGTARLSAGAGLVFGDGLRCAGGTVIRLGVEINVGGASRYPRVGEQPVAARGLVSGAGLREYQVWYRDAATFCGPSTFNLTNGLEISWTN